MSKAADTSPLSAAYRCLCSQLLSLRCSKTNVLGEFFWQGSSSLTHCTVQGCCSASNHWTSAHFLYKEQTIFPWLSPLIVTEGGEENSEWNIGFNQDFIMLFQKMKKDSCLAVHFGEDLIYVNRFCLWWVLNFMSACIIIFTESIVKHWHRASRESPSLEVFKKPADVPLGDMIWWWMYQCWVNIWTLWSWTTFPDWIILWLYDFSSVSLKGGRGKHV